MTIEQTISNLRIILNHVNHVLSLKLTEEEYIRASYLHTRLISELIDLVRVSRLVEGTKIIEKDELLDPIIKDSIEVDELMKELIEC